MRSSTAPSARTSQASSRRLISTVPGSKSPRATSKSARKIAAIAADDDDDQAPTTTTTMTTWRNNTSTSTLTSSGATGASDAPGAREVPPSRRSALLAAGGIALSGALAGFTKTAGAAEANSSPAAAATAASAAATASSSTPPYKIAYFGNGCFWGRQHDFVEVETKQLGRSPEQLTSVTGYAGGARGAAPDGRVCYYYANDNSVYERRGHAEVVRVGLAPLGSSSSSSASEKEQEEEAMRAFSRAYFAQFVPRKSRDGKLLALRQDPQDAGPGYRNVVGLPGGGIQSPLFKILDEERAKSPLAEAITLVEGRGNDFVSGRPLEDDRVGVVYVYDSDKLPFFPAERWHQYHSGLGKSFDDTYRKKFKRAAEEAGAFGPTGCPEFPFL